MFRRTFVSFHLRRRRGTFRLTPARGTSGHLLQVFVSYCAVVSETRPCIPELRYAGLHRDAPEVKNADAHFGATDCGDQGLHRPVQAILRKHRFLSGQKGVCVVQRTRAALFRKGSDENNLLPRVILFGQSGDSMPNVLFQSSWACARIFALGSKVHQAIQFAARVEASFHRPIRVANKHTSFVPSRWHAS